MSNIIHIGFNQLLTWNRFRKEIFALQKINKSEFIVLIDKYIESYGVWCDVFYTERPCLTSIDVELQEKKSYIYISIFNFFYTFYDCVSH